MVELADGEYIVKKHRYGAFTGTALDNTLRENGIRTLVVTGVQTNVCVETTLREGLSRGYYIVVPADCVATHSSDLHDATLQNVERLFGDVTSTAALMATWTDGASVGE